MARNTDASGAASELPEVNFSDYGDIRFLHLGTEWVQGSMLIDAPFDIQLEYVQRMMVWLLFVEPHAVAGLHSMQLGLGSAALTKFCYKKLRMRTTAIEINPQVLAACRLWFKFVNIGNNHCCTHNGGVDNNSSSSGDDDNSDKARPLQPAAARATRDRCRPRRGGRGPRTSARVTTAIPG
jgi:hypothetical protein